MTLFIPSPSISSFQIGPLTIHIYALCLITGIVAAWMLGVRRWRARGGRTETFETVLLWAIPIGILGARFYHVMTHLGDYFGPGINPWTVFAIWQGGIAIYGAIGFGALAAWVAARKQRIAFAALADALAPGIAIGQAMGRFGNWFNQELYGQPTTLPWGLEIDPAHRAPGYEQYATFHPTFLYESIWNLLVAGVLLWADRRFRLGRGKVFALYVALYGFGRIFTESIRLDYSYDFFGPVRFNAAVAMLICLAGVVLFAWLSRFRPGREEVVEFGVTAGADKASQEGAEAAPAEADPAAPGAADPAGEQPEAEGAGAGSDQPQP
ncbi:prolipoprotein diacylglyceryl transferase [Propionicimonas sp.]|uniref:prolipoprotein diacylglyceryl transferase n=1 Tax=Propionicimonas sp. TaxID=1955623 RepID=UPI0039E2AFA4